MSSNSTIVGNLTRDPELHIAPSGMAVLSFSVAVNKNKKGANGEWEKEAHYFDCVCFGDQAENVAASATKGNRLIVSGYLQQRTWEDKDSGAKRSKVELVADEVAVSLRWATAAITKVEFDSEGGGGNRAPQQSRQQNSFNEEPF